MILETRADTGLRQPVSIGTNVWPQRGGLAVHYGGDHQGITPDSPHTTCRTRLRSWQDYHMNTHGWVDLAYNWVICQHAIVMVGRGWGVRSAANGTNDSNDRYLAACWMGGQGDPGPDAHVLGAFTELIAEFRRRGGGRDVRPHRYFYSTDCPGDVLAARAAVWRQDTAVPGSVPGLNPPFPLPSGWYFGPADGPEESVSGYFSHRADLAVWQVRAGLTGDGLYGPLTAARALRVQKDHSLNPDSLIGPWTWKAVWQ